MRVAYAVYDPKTRVCRTYPNAQQLVVQAAEALGLETRVTDQRTKPDLDLQSLDPKEFRSVCFDALQTVAKARSSGIIVAPTGVGKTSILCGLLKMLPKNLKVLVTTEDKNVTNQLYKSISEVLQEPIGICNRPRIEKGRVIVANLDALKEFTQGEMLYSGCALRDFDIWICDEVHRLPVESRIPFISQLRPLYAWGLTATPKRIDNAHLLNHVYFGPTLFQVSHQEVLERQRESEETGIVPIEVLVFPLYTETPIPEESSLYQKTKLAYLKNPKLASLLQGIDGMLPAETKVLLFVDTYRLGVLLRKALPQYVFIHGRIPLNLRENTLHQFKSGKQCRVISTDIWSEGIDVPDLGFVIDCSSKMSPNLIIQRAGRAARSADGKQCGRYVMLLCISSGHLFQQGIHKLKAMASRGWNIKFMFSRDVADNLPFEQAPLLSELGEFCS